MVWELHGGFNDAVFGDWDGLEYDDCGVHSLGLVQFSCEFGLYMSPPICPLSPILISGRSGCSCLGTWGRRIAFRRRMWISGCEVREAEDACVDGEEMDEAFGGILDGCLDVNRFVWLHAGRFELI